MIREFLTYKLKFYLRMIITYLFYKPMVSRIGRKCIIMSPNIISGLRYMNIGDNVLIFPNNRIEIIGKYGGDSFKPTFKIGNNTQIHQNCHITCAGRIDIGNNVIITANVTITDITHPYEDINVPINKQPIKVGSVVIGDQTYIYNNAVLMPNIKIGKHCVVGANSLVCNDVPDYCVVVGSPARIVKRYNISTGNWEKFD